MINNMFLLLLAGVFFLGAQNVKAESILLHNNLAEFVEFDLEAEVFGEEFNIWDKEITSSQSVQYVQSLDAILIASRDGAIRLLDRELNIVVESELPSGFDSVDDQILLSQYGGRFLVPSLDKEKNTFSLDFVDTKSMTALASIECFVQPRVSHFINDDSFICGQIPATKGISIFNVDDEVERLNVDFSDIVQRYSFYNWLNPVLGFDGRVFLIGSRSDHSEQRNMLILDVENGQELGRWENIPYGQFFNSTDGENLLVEDYTYEKTEFGFGIRTLTGNWYLVNFTTLEETDRLNIKGANYIGYSVNRGQYYFLSPTDLYVVNRNEWPKFERHRLPRSSALAEDIESGSIASQRFNSAVLLK